MANKRPRTPAKSAEQKKRTFRNQFNRYTKLITKFPTNPHVKIWEKLKEIFSKTN